jgi:transcriptional regulator of nitric oxide reductase
MVPVGAVEPVLGVTVAVKVMDVPTVGDAGEAVMTVVVSTRPEVAIAPTAVAKASASIEPQPVTWS